MGGGRQGFEITKINDWKKGDDRVPGLRHHVHPSFSIFSKHLMIPNLMAILKTTIF